MNEIWCSFLHKFPKVIYFTYEKYCVNNTGIS